MNRSYRILPVYTGDVSGACSALYELGGMVVIHDPSGCNSTYNTHDETRWYEQDSLIFLSGLTDIDAILGNDDKLIADVVDAVRELHPKFIALCNSPIPFINGTDFAAIARLIEKRTGVPCFHVPTNGMHDYTVGAGNALLKIAERFVTPAKKRPRTLNILGLTPLDYGIKASPGEFREFAAEAGYEVVSCWAMGDGLEALTRSAEAAVNLVVSSVGLPAAEYLNKLYGMPFVVGAPVGAFRPALIEAVRTAEATGLCSYPCRDRRTANGQSVRRIVGEPVTMGSLSAALEAETGEPFSVVCPLETPPALLCPGDISADGEEEIEAALSDARLVIADPLFKPVLPAEARLVPLPHQAFSGRNYWKSTQSLLNFCANQPFLY